MKKALITGVTGQDGSYLANLLLTKGYQVFGTYRRTSSVNNWRLNYFNLNDNKNFHLVELDLTDQGNCRNVIERIKPNEIYNLAAQSFVGVSFEQPNTTTQINSIGTLNLLESIRFVGNDIKFYQASTSEMFGKVQSIPQTEETPFYPRSPYGVSKLYAHWITVNYSESYNIFATSGILFNHESPLRGKEFITRKITDNVSKIKHKLIESFKVGNLDAKRDWGFAGDYVQGMWAMLQVDTPSTYILATNRTETVRSFLKMSFDCVNIDIIFEGDGINEKVIEKSTGKILVETDPNFYRPAEVDILIGDYSKAKKYLNWEPRMKLESLCEHMVEEDLLKNSKFKSFK